MSRHVTHVPMRWADMDAYSHVNNVVFLRYLQEARVDLLYVHAARLGAGGLASGMLVVRHDIDYLVPLTFRTSPPLRVETCVREVRNSTVTVAYDVLDERDGQRRVYASATTTLAPYDRSADRPRRLTAEEKGVLERFLEPPDPAGEMRRDPPASPGDTTKTHAYECAVRFDDLDSYGHVNNVTFAEYVQEARIDFAYRQLLHTMGSYQGSVVANQRIDYLAPVPSRVEPLQVLVWVTRVGGSSFDLAYEVRDAERAYARATSALVAYDLEEQRSRKITAAERDVLEPFVQGDR